MFRRFLFFFVCLWFVILPLAVTSSSYFTIDPVLSGLRFSNGIYYTKTWSLSLSGTIDPMVAAFEFSGTTEMWGLVYASGNSFAAINARFPTNASLTGGVWFWCWEIG